MFNFQNLPAGTTLTPSYTASALILEADVLPLTSISISPSTPSIGKGLTESFTATGTYSDNSTANITNEVTWTSSNTAVASITGAGVAKGVAAGSSTITAALDGINGSTTLTVTSVTVASITSVSPNPRNSPVSDENPIEVTLSESARPGTFTSSDLTLTDNGGPNLIMSAVSVALVSGSEYAILDLEGLTMAEGSYVLTVYAAGITGQDGGEGTGSASTSWLMDTTPPTSTVNALPPTSTNPNLTISVTASDPNGADNSLASGIASIALFDSDDGGTFKQFATVTASGSSAPFTGQVGHTYGFYSVATDNAGNTQPTSTAAQTTVQILASLTVTSVGPISPNPGVIPLFRAST